MTISINFKLPFDEAINAMASRGVVLPEEYYGKLQGLARQLSYSVAGLAKLDQIQGVLDSLEHAIANGGTFAQWQKIPEIQALNLPKHRLDNIFRTNIQQAYNQGQWLKQVGSRQSKPYLLYDAINDSRTRPMHSANNGVIRKVDDPIWKRIWFGRNVYRCRCRLISLTEDQAIARSKGQTGIHKVATEDPHRDTAWDHVDVLGGDVLSFGLERAVAQRLESGKVNKVLLSAFENKLKQLPDMNVIQLESFVPVQKAMTELAAKNPQWFPEGFNDIYAVSNSNFFAANAKGAFYFSNTIDSLTGFTPATDLASAFKKMQTDIEISFNEEYALETLWHEMMHARALHTNFPSKNVMVATEGIHQWLSRRSYQQLLTEFNVKPIHQDSIIRKGLAYQNEVDNFNALLSILAIQGGDVASDIEKLWLSGVSAQDAKAQVALLLAQKSQIRDSRINKAFNYLSIESVDFVAKVKKIISY